MNQLKLENQICFPLYAASKEIIKRYTPLLKEIDLTYTQYITMLVLWEKKEISVKELGKILFLDSGTLTPVIKKLESLNFVKRERLKSDERIVVISITDNGEKLKEKASTIPMEIINCVNLDKEELSTLYNLLYKILEN